MKFFCGILRHTGVKDMDMKKTQAGRSMIEMMGYLMVAMGVIIAMGKIVSSAFDNHKYSTASLQLSELVGAIVRSSAIDVDYTEVVDKVNGKCEKDSTTVTVECAKTIVPNTYRVVPGSNKVSIYHAFGGKVQVDIYNNDPEKFYVKFLNLSKKQCIELAMKDWRRNQYADLFAVMLPKAGSSWYWQAYGNASGNAVNVASGSCTGGSNPTCALPVSRVMLTGKNKSDNSAQCKDNRENEVMWIFN